MTAVVLRPNQTVAGADSVTQGTAPGATAHQVTADASDSSYYQDDEFTTTPVILGLDTVSLPAGAITKQMRVRARLAGTAGVPGTVRVKVDIPTYAQSVPSIDAPIFNTTISDTTSPYVAVNLTQAQLDGARITTGFTYANTSALDYRVYALYVDLIYVTQPVVILDAITDPYTDSSSLPLSWDTTLDPDGGAQTQVYILVQNQVGGAVVFSQFISGAAESFVLPPLPNGDYIVNIRVAQTVNGTLFWSEYDTQSNVTINVTPAEVDTLQATAYDQYGYIFLQAVRLASGEDWEFIEIERSSDGGTTWEPVRLATVVNASADQFTFAASDYEAPQGVDLYYRARAIWFDDGLAFGSELPRSGAVVSDWTWSNVVSWEVPNPDCEEGAMRIHSVNDYTLNMTVTILMDGIPSTTSEAEQGTFQVIDQVEQVGISGVRHSPSGTLRVITTTLIENARLEALLAENIVCLLPPHSWGWTDIKYIQLGSVVRGRPGVLGAQPVTEWTINFTVIARPADVYAGEF